MYQIYQDHLKKQQEFDENIATTHEEYAAELKALLFSNQFSIGLLYLGQKK